MRRICGKIFRNSLWILFYLVNVKWKFRNFLLEDQMYLQILSNNNFEKFWNVKSVKIFYKFYLSEMLPNVPDISIITVEINRKLLSNLKKSRFSRILTFSIFEINLGKSKCKNCVGMYILTLHGFSSKNVHLFCDLNKIYWMMWMDQIYQKRFPCRT